jgi:hypothetical protein
MKSLPEVRDTLTKLFNDLQANAVGTEVAKEMNKAASSVIETFKLEMRYGK